MKYKKVNMEREKKENFLFIYLYQIRVSVLLNI